MTDADDNQVRRPFSLTLLTGLYLFFFLLSITTYGSPFPFMGNIYQNTPAKILVFFDSMLCIYLFLGIFKRQTLTWYLLLGYNFIEILNSIANLIFIKTSDIEKLVGATVEENALIINNVAVAMAILLLSQFIYRSKKYFNNPDKFLF